MNKVKELKEKLSKLLRHAESAQTIGSFREAEAFMAKFHGLLNQYGFEAAEIQDYLEQQGTESEQVNGEKFIPWEHGLDPKRACPDWYFGLAGIVASAHYCEVVGWSKTNVLYFVGREAERKIAAYMFGVLARTIEQLSEQNYREYYNLCRKAGRPSQARGYKQSYITGFVKAIRRRYWEMRQGTSTALVLSRTRGVKEFVERLNPERIKPALNDPNYLGMLHGMRDGQEVSLEARALESTGASPAKALGGER